MMKKGRNADQWDCKDVNIHIREANDALHEAARELAKLARDEPRIEMKKASNQSEYQKPNIVSIRPTGDLSKDVANLEQAIADAGPGGIVLLKARDKSGNPVGFNLTQVGDLLAPHEISLKCEKDARILFREQVDI